MVGIPILAIVLILRAGDSHKVPPPLGKTWQLNAPQTPNADSKNPPDNIAQCYGLKLPATIRLEQSGLFLHASMGNESTTGKIHENTWQLEFKPHSGPCAGETTRLHGEINEKNMTWPAVIESQSCTKCAPIHVVINRQKD